MKKENKFLIAIIIVGIITLAGVIFFAVKYPYIKANKNAESIEIGDNTDLEDLITVVAYSMNINPIDMENMTIRRFNRYFGNINVFRFNS